eukprot:3606079-Pyramimonas_sp.AAC.2
MANCGSVSIGSRTPGSAMRNSEIASFSWMSGYIKFAPGAQGSFPVVYYNNGVLASEGGTRNGDRSQPARP